MSIVTVERSDAVAAREAAAGVQATLARNAEAAARNAADNAANCAGNGDKDMAGAWAQLAVEAAGTALGHFHRANEAHPGSTEVVAARQAAKRAEDHARRALALAARD